MAMKTLLTLLLSCTVALAAGKSKGKVIPTINGWFACNTAGKIQSTTFQASGDVVTQIVPLQGSGCLSFLVTEQLAFTGDLRTKTITATVEIERTTAARIFGCVQSVTTPPNFRLYVSSVTGPYNLNNGLRHPWDYWWSSNASYYNQDTDGPNVNVILTATFDPAKWTAALGQLGSTYPDEFSNAIAGVRQIGFSFGSGSYYDTGIWCNPGSAIIHLLSFSVQ